MKKLIKLFLIVMMMMCMTMTVYAGYNDYDPVNYFLPNLILTILIHPFPLLVYRYCIVKEPISPKKSHKIITIYGLVIAFINGFFAGSKGFIPVLIWSAIIEYFFTKGYKEDVENDLNQAIENSSSQMSQEKTSSQTDDTLKR